jgi:hypothetical protein
MKTWNFKYTNLSVKLETSLISPLITSYMGKEKGTKASPTYKKYLIEKPSKDIMLEEKSKVSVAYIINPYNPKRPSRIIGIGSSINKAYSWKRINRIHMSDVSLIAGTDQKSFFGALYSRLANTHGVVKIESIPNGRWVRSGIFTSGPRAAIQLG